MNYRITHQTAYAYSEPASLSQNELLLTPRPTDAQQVLTSDLTVVPQPQYLRQHQDYFGNTVQVFMVQQPHTTLTVTAVSRVALQSAPIPDAATTPPWEEVAAQLAQHRTPEDLNAFQFVFPSPLVTLPAAARDYARPSFASGTPLLMGAIDLMGRIFREFTYDKTATTVDTEVDQVLTQRRGVCQDFAHLAISCLRSLGLAARYISGYLKTLPPPGKPRLIGADASHAWLALFIPGIGWVDLDPTNNQIPTDAHITLAWGRDYGDVPPLKGVVMGGGQHKLTVMVDVGDDCEV